MRRRWRARILLGGAAIATLVLATVWWQRTTLTQGALDRVLAARGVPARYRVTAIGIGWQRIEDVVIGDPRAPDLTAKWVEVRLEAGWNGVRASAIRAGGVRGNAAMRGGKLTFGAVDRLLPRSDRASPLALPDLDVALADARLRLATDIGAIDVRLDGRGNLAHSFAGTVVAWAPRLARANCRGDRVSAEGRLTTRDRRIGFIGPVRAGRLDCGGLITGNAVLAVDGRLSPQMDRAAGRGVLRVASARGGGLAFERLGGRVRVDGPLAALRGTMELASASGRYGDIRFAGATLAGRYDLAGAGAAQGIVRVKAVRLPPAQVAALLEAAHGTAQTPLGPAVFQVARAAGDAGRMMSLEATAGLAAGGVTIGRVVARSASGARFMLDGGQGVRIDRAGVSVDARMTLAGGGFPDFAATVDRRTDGLVTAIARVAPFGPAGSRLVLAPIRFAMRRSGALLVETEAKIDGPLPGGQVSGLRLPVALFRSADNVLIVNRGCTPVAFAQARFGNVVLDPARLTLCPQGQALMVVRGGRPDASARLEATRLTGRVGTTPLAFAFDALMLDGPARAIRASGLSARLGSGTDLSRIEVAGVTGSPRGGRFEGLGGQLANVPLVISEGAGPWSFVGGVLRLSGVLKVADAAAEPRFFPLVSNDVAFALADGRIDVTGTLAHPATGTAVTRATICHDLARGTGSAVLDVPRLAFGRALQPEAITPLTIGVIANLQGAISGRGAIDWSRSGVTSSGRFRIDGGMNFAAAFGPVEGMRGEIVFDDLLALATPAGQTVSIDSINPGIPVEGGTIRYRLLAGQKLAIERGAWPFAGGDLLLEPAVIDMGKDAARALTFRIVALDAARFVQRLEFENLAATGIFDGTLPMVFDESGGRITGGSLAVRAEGGTLAYVGEVSNADMNIFGRIAFDALKSMRYRNLTISLDGPLDGEIVSLVRFTGINQAPIKPSRNIITRQFLGLPFRFNIAVRAPFRGLLSTARTFTDPSLLIRRTEPLREPPGVQPAESAPRR